MHVSRSVRRHTRSVCATFAVSAVSFASVASLGVARADYPMPPAPGPIPPPSMLVNFQCTSTSALPSEPGQVGTKSYKRISVYHRVAPMPRCSPSGPRSSCIPFPDLPPPGGVSVLFEEYFPNGTGAGTQTEGNLMESQGGFELSFQAGAPRVLIGTWFDAPRPGTPDDPVGPGNPDHPVPSDPRRVGMAELRTEPFSSVEEFVCAER
jgi:hypothetical protein